MNAYNPPIRTPKTPEEREGCFDTDGKIGAMPSARATAASQSSPQAVSSRAGIPIAVTDDCCDLCCAVPVAEVIDGDRMCAACADAWAEPRSDDDLVPLSKLYAMGVLPVKGFE